VDIQNLLEIGTDLSGPATEFPGSTA